MLLRTWKSGSNIICQICNLRDILASKQVTFRGNLVVYLWIVGRNTCISFQAFVLKSPWKIFFERKMKVWKLFKSTNMLFLSVCNINNSTAFSFSSFMPREMFNNLKKKNTFLTFGIKSIFIPFYIFLSPWMYEDGALYSWICSKHIRANMITQKWKSLISSKLRCEITAKKWLKKMKTIRICRNAFFLLQL